MRVTIKLSTNDTNLNIPITGINNLLGYDDDINALVNGESGNAINTVTDAEVRRIEPATTYTLNFNFWNGSSFVQQVAPLEFSSSDFNTTEALNSFYIIQMYDTFKEEIQNKKHTGYYNGYDFAIKTLNSSYQYSKSIEFSDLYFSQNLIDSMSGLTTNFYVKFLFYSGKSGKFYPFYNGNDNLTTQQKLYYTISVNPNTLSYTFTNGSPLNIFEVTNTGYTSAVNNTVPSFPVQKSTYPTGNTFTMDGNYITQ